MGRSLISRPGTRNHVERGEGFVCTFVRQTPLVLVAGRALFDLVFLPERAEVFIKPLFKRPSYGARVTGRTLGEVRIITE